MPITQTAEIETNTRTRTGDLPLNPSVERAFDEEVTSLVDALVEAIDLQRWAEIDRVRSALEPFGATSLFDAELRLNGVASIDEWCICGGEEF